MSMLKILVFQTGWGQYENPVPTIQFASGIIHIGYGVELIQWIN